MTVPVYDMVGVGFGPANLALAVMLEEAQWAGTRLFIDRAPCAAWQAGMMLDGSDIQHNPLRDLVTPRNPRSHYSFVNYLHSEGRLFDFLNLPLKFPLRKEFARYVGWVAGHFEAETWPGTEVTGILPDGQDGGPVWRVELGVGSQLPFVRARSLVVGTGRTPNVPAEFADALGPRVFHLSEYLPRIGQVADSGRAHRIVVIGASQSAVEIMLDLGTRFPETECLCLTRSFGFRLKDTSPFSERVYFPDFVDYYYDAGDRGKDALDSELTITNYSAVDKDVLEELYCRMYEQQLDGCQRLKHMGNVVVNRVVASRDHVLLEIEDRFRPLRTSVEADAVVLATGFRNFGVGEGKEPIVPLLAEIADWFEMTPKRGVYVTRSYALRPKDASIPVPPIYLNGLCESSHGLGDAGSFSLLSLRAQQIAEDLIKRLTETATVNTKESP